MIYLSMRTVALFCFFGAFLFDPTLGWTWFVANNSARTDEYYMSDARNLFHQISTDLNQNRVVTLAAPPTAFAPLLGSIMNFSMNLQSRYLNGYNQRTGRPNVYSFNGRLINLGVMQGIMPLLRLETREEPYEGVSSLWLDVTVLIAEMHVQSHINYEASWRDMRWVTRDGLFFGHWSNIAVRYQTRLRLVRDGRSQLIGSPMTQPVVAVNRVIVNSIDVSAGNTGNLFSWRASDHNNTETDRIIESLSPPVLTRIVSVIGGIILMAIGDRPYSAPHVTVATAAANVSGYSCRRPPSRESRETKLYN